MVANKSLYTVLLLLILLGGALVRLVYVLQLDEKLWWEDEVDYLALGHSIASGDGFVTPNGEPTAFRPPGYPLLLTGLIIIGFDTVTEIRLVHVFFNIATLFILFLLSLKIAGPAAALISTTLAAGYPYFVFGVGTLFAFSWFSFTLLTSIYFLLKGVESTKYRYIALAGLLMGVSILTRTSAAVLGFLSMLWLIIVLHRSIKKFLIVALLYGAAMTIVVTPWLIRNALVFGEPVLSTNGGRNLWLGNNPESTVNSGSDIPMPAALQTRIDAATEIQAEAIYTAEAIKNIRQNPRHYITLMLKKGLALWRFDPSPTTDGYPRYKNLYSMISILTYTPIFFLAVLGFLLADSRQKKNMLLFLFFALGFTLLHAVFISKVRFRLPLDYLLMLMAGSAVMSIAQRSHLFRRFLTRYSGFFHDQNSPTFSLPFIRRR